MTRNDSESAANPDPRCPRCGYDQRGIVAAWRDACPLEGQCTECGLRLDWRDLLNPSLNRPRWSIEYAPLGRVPLALVTTLLMMLRPWRFWRELKMVHEVRGTRLALFVFAVVLAIYIFFAVSIGRAEYERNLLWQTYGMLLRHDPWTAALRAAAMPFAFDSNIVKSPFPVPSGQIKTLASQYSSPLFGPRRFFRFDFAYNPWNAIRAFAWHAIWMVAFAPLAFAMLPVSRRIAKVRWRHVLRIWAYSSVFLALPLAVDIYDQMFSSLHQTSMRWGAAIFLITAGALLVWWSIATRDYLRLRHPWAVGATVVVLAYLAHVTIFIAIDFVEAIA